MPKQPGRRSGRVLFAEGFEAVRSAKGFSRKYVADVAEVSPQFLADLLACRAGAGADAQKRIANALGVPPEALFPEMTGWVGPLLDRDAVRSARRGPREAA